MNIEHARRNMLTQQIRCSDLCDPALLDEMENVPREQFVPEEQRAFAFSEYSLPLGQGQYTLTPNEEARILHILNVTPTDKVLQLGAAGGYLTALLAKIGQHVYCVDNVAEHIESIEKKLGAFNIKNVTLLLQTDVSEAPAHEAPFDIIVATGSLPRLPQRLIEKLSVGGRLFAIIGDAPAMKAILVTRQTKTQYTQRSLFETQRVRLPGAKETDTFKF